MDQGFSINDQNKTSSILVNLLQNLSRKQKIVILVVSQIIFIIAIILIINNTILKPRDRVDTFDNKETLKNVPQAEIELYEQELWKVISKTDKNLDKSVIDDVVVREDSYTEEIDKNNNMHQVSFVIDIDSIQQSYRVILSWNNSNLNTPIIDCLPISESKYPNSYCQGSYRNSDDLTLYLPYWVYPQGYDNPNAGPMAPDIYIDGDRTTQTITISLSTCNTEENKKKALKYLEDTPIDLSQYEIKYNISNVNAVCEGNS